MIAHNITRHTVVSACVIPADNFFKRLLGLMFKKSIPAGHGMLLTPCQSIHTVFMRFPIDAIYLDKKNRVLDIDEALLPYRLGSFHRKTVQILELNAGDIRRSETQKGDYLQFE